MLTFKMKFIIRSQESYWYVQIKLETFVLQQGVDQNCKRSSWIRVLSDLDAKLKLYLLSERRLLAHSTIALLVLLGISNHSAAYLKLLIIISKWVNNYLITRDNYWLVREENTLTNETQKAISNRPWSFIFQHILVKFFKKLHLCRRYVAVH